LNKYTIKGKNDGRGCMLNHPVYTVDD